MTPPAPAATDRTPPLLVPRPPGAAIRDHSPGHWARQAPVASATTEEKAATVGVRIAGAPSVPREYLKVRPCQGLRLRAPRGEGGLEADEVVDVEDGRAGGAVAVGIR